MKKIHILALVVLLLLAAVTVLILASDNVHAPTDRTSTKKSQQTAMAKQQVRLPGATPIEAIPGDISSPEHTWILVSKTYPLTNQRFMPTDLTKPNIRTRTDKTEAEQMLRKSAAVAVEKMFADAEKNGIVLGMASGFRGYELQQEYFTSYAKMSGVEAANTYSALPGQSEHQTGLALDIMDENRTCYLEVCFENTAAGKWLTENASSYGFIIRYPKNKTDSTKYQYEPWHFRFVGIAMSNAIQKSGLTFDEARPYILKAYSE